MKRAASLFFSVVLSIFFAISITAQTSTFKDNLSDYTFELPEPVWKMNFKPTADKPHPQYIHGDRLNGYLQVDKTSIKPDALMSDAIKDAEAKLRFKPGFIAGKEENFAGALKGKVFNYEFIQSGKNMSGRIYLLRADENTVYTLHFTGLRDSLKGIRNQTDSIARTFKISKPSA
jgi:hypothetical protein